MNFPENTFKRALKSGAPQVGLWLGLADAYCAEICATAGFDWLLIDGEHAPNDLRSTLVQLQAIAVHGGQAIVRTPGGDVNLIKQLLDVGVQTLMVPLVETAEYASAMVAAMRYPPSGVRGVVGGLARASFWGSVENYVQRANGEMCLIAQIESSKGVHAVKEIAEVDGVDGLFIGPADLAASLGHLGNPQHPDVLRVIRDAIANIRECGKSAGIFCLNEKQAHSYLDSGCSFVAAGVDAMLLANAARALAGKFGLRPKTDR